MRAFLALVVLATFSLATSARAQYCPADPPPSAMPGSRPPKRQSHGGCLGGGGSDPGGSGGGSDSPGGAGGGDGPPSPPHSTDSKAGANECVGDPVTVFGHHSYTLDRIEDVLVKTALGYVSFQRTFVSSDSPWKNGRTDLTQTLTGVPKPFGASRVSCDDSQRWSHNFFSFITTAGSAWRVRTPRGTLEEFSQCTAPCWAPLIADSPGQRSRLKRLADGTFRFHQDDGHEYAFEQTPDGGVFYLSKSFDTSGRTLATVSYAAPSAACPSINAGGVPYISQVVPVGGPTLNFHYTALATPAPCSTDGGPLQCVLRAVVTADDAGVTYTYEGNAAGHLASATTPEFIETYSSYATGFAVQRLGAAVVTHGMDAGLDAGTVLDVADSSGLISLAPTLVDETSSGGCFGDVACCSMPRSRLASIESARSGDGLETNPGFTEKRYFASGNFSVVHRQMPIARVDACTDTNACSAGTFRWLYRPTDLSSSQCYGQTPGSLYATKDKRDFWTVTPHRFLDGGATSGNHAHESVGDDVFRGWSAHRARVLCFRKWEFERTAEIPQAVHRWQQFPRHRVPELHVAGRAGDHHRRKRCRNALHLRRAPGDVE